ncbi:beta strand repeat-containing protein [Viscerimonas tarda]
MKEFIRLDRESPRDEAHVEFHETAHTIIARFNPASLGISNKSRSFAVILAFATLCCFIPFTAYAAATATVTNNSDGTGSLRQAIANVDDGGTISFSSNMAGKTIDLTAGLEISKSVTIVGNGVTLDGSGITPGANSQILLVSASGKTITLSGLHFRNGTAESGGGAIRNNGGTLNLESCVFSGNQTTATTSDGGAIYSTGSTTTLNVRGCTFYNNSASAGGAICSYSGTVTLTGNIFFGNTGAASNRGNVVHNYSQSTCSSGGYNVSDKATGTDNTLGSGFTFTTGDMQETTLPFNTTTFVSALTSVLIVPSGLENFPATDFNGDTRIFPNGAAGAVMKTSLRVVTNANNNGAGSLRQALETLELDTPLEGVTIFFAPGMAGQTINLTSSMGPIRRSVTIAAPGVTLDGSGITSNSKNILEISGISTSQTFTLSGFHFKNANDAISHYRGTLNLESCVFSGNRDTSDGGAIENYATLNVRGCTFYNNKTGPGLSRGGAIYNSDNGTLMITGNIFYGNTANRGNVVYTNGSGTVTSGGYNVSDKASGSDYANDSGFTFAMGDMQETTLPFNTTTFAPTLASVLIVPAGVADFPATDFYGNARTFPGGAAGAVEHNGIVLTAGTVSRTSDTNVTVKFTSNKAGQYYYQVVADNAGDPNIDTSGEGTACGTSEVTLSPALTAGAWDIYVVVKDAAGNVSASLKIDIPVPLYTVTLNVNKDGEAWSDHGKTLTLKLTGEETTTADISSGTASVPNGTWKVYEGTTDTGATITINGATASATLNYYTVYFWVSTAGLASGSTISAIYNGASISSGAVVLGGKALVITASGAGASIYTYAWSGAGTSAQTTDAITVSALAGAVNATCTVTGVPITVANADDSGTGSLRQAIADIADGGIISFAPGMAGQTIALTTARLEIAKSVTIAGNGVTLDGSGIAAGTNSQILRVSASGKIVTLSGLHFRNGKADDYGGAIRNDNGTLNLESCVFSDNQTTASVSFAGAIYNNATLNVRGCTFYNNKTGPGLSRGGAIYNSDNGTLMITGNIFYGNTANRGNVVYTNGSGTVTSGGYNVSDKASGSDYANDSGFTFAMGDMQETTLPFNTTTFAPTLASVLIVPAGVADFPATDFNGAARTFPNGAAGAVETAGIITGIDNIVGAKSIVSESYYDLTGKPVSATAKGFVIKRTVYDDGSVINNKGFIK